MPISRTIGPEEFAGHWQLTVEFLKILTEQWPRYLADNGLVSPVARRTLLMARETERLAKGSAYPVIAAGSTGTLPATAAAVEGDRLAPERGGRSARPRQVARRRDLGAGSADVPEHPQHGMAALLRDTRRNARRCRLPAGCCARALPPARGSTSRARRCARPRAPIVGSNFLRGDALAAEGKASLADALSGLQLVVAPTAHDEAEAIALILRSAVETKGKTAALVTPDRTLGAARGGAAQALRACG